MPIYEYRCKSCDTRFEALRSRAQADTQPAPCPECQSAATMRLLSVFSAHVPGSKENEIGAGEPCTTSERLGMPCCGGGCRLPN